VLQYLLLGELSKGSLDPRSHTNENWVSKYPVVVPQALISEQTMQLSIQELLPGTLRPALIGLAVIVL
jgi:hypothetical protein